MQPELVVLSGGRGMRIRVKLPTVIGRSDEAKLKIRQGRISRRHCALSQRGDAFWIEDLSSSNGTFLNGVRISEPRQLVHADNIRIGDIVFRFELTVEPVPVANLPEKPSPVTDSLPRLEAPSPDPTEAQRHENVVHRGGSEGIESEDSVRFEDDIPSQRGELLPSFLRYREQSGGSFIGIETENDVAKGVIESVEIDTGDKAANAISQIGRIVLDPESETRDNSLVDSEALASFLRGLG